MSIYLLMPAHIKYIKYFNFNNIDIENSSDEMIPKYRRLIEIRNECMQNELSNDEADQRYGREIGSLFHAIKCKEFVCKVDKVTFLGEMKMIAQFWGDYYAEIDFDEILKLPEVQERHPDFEILRNPEVFHKVYPAQYDVFFGEEPESCVVSSDFIWHFGKRIQVNEEEYEWIRGW